MPRSHMYGHDPLKIEEIPQLDGSDLHQRWMYLFDADDLTPEEQKELAAIEAEQEIREEEQEGYLGPLSEEQMRRWNIDSNDVMGYTGFEG